jgi:steroid delta-isomerase-like uncharacterized protein
MENTMSAAKAVILAYNEKNWDKLRASVDKNIVYDEKGTGRRVEGVDALIELLKGWGRALPDSKATFNETMVSGNSAVFEVVWKGTHSGPLATPNGTVPASNKPIDVPACQVLTVEGDKVKKFTHYFNLMTLLTQIGAAGL